MQHIYILLYNNITEMEVCKYITWRCDIATFYPLSQNTERYLHLTTLISRYTLPGMRCAHL